MSKKPTRIIEEPRRLTGKFGRNMLIKCNNGKEYNLKQLSEAIGISSPTLQERIKTHGWWHKLVLSPKKHTKFFKPKCELPEDIGGEPGDCAHIPHKSRFGNLEKIKGPTKYDEMYAPQRKLHIPYDPELS